MLEAIPSPDETATWPPVFELLRPLQQLQAPPIPLVPLPTWTVNIPALLDVAPPDPTRIPPLFPEEAEPVLKTRWPLTPQFPAFDARTKTVPLLETVPSPDDTHTVPPLSRALSPPAVAKPPPVPLVPLPTASIIRPPLPRVLALEPKCISPEFPENVEPVLNKSFPLAPETPLFIDSMLRAPLLVAEPSPVDNGARPPVHVALRPAFRVAMLPVPLVPLPATMKIPPPRPAVVAPEPTRRTPLFPSFEDPELKTMQPLRPTAPELDVRMHKAPLLALLPSPVQTAIAPPEAV